MLRAEAKAQVQRSPNRPPAPSFFPPIFQTAFSRKHSSSSGGAAARRTSNLTSSWCCSSSSARRRCVAATAPPLTLLLFSRSVPPGNRFLFCCRFLMCLYFAGRCFQKGTGLGFSRNWCFIVSTGVGRCFAANGIFAGRTQERAVVVAGNQWWREGDGFGGQSQLGFD